MSLPWSRRGRAGEPGIVRVSIRGVLNFGRRVQNFRKVKVFAAEQVTKVDLGCKRVVIRDFGSVLIENSEAEEILEQKD
jgi:ABC-type Na+ transport system ATPase subunit NatA